MNYELNKVCDIHTNKFDCPDCLIEYNEIFDEYSIIIHDGGSSSITIYYCPWCGTKLPVSMRSEWFEKLYALNIDPDDENKIPNEFKSNEWRLKK
jgi:predicted RNA-binding Zn-ribbon protein involved in translation (DUF1610 family)